MAAGGRFRQGFARSWRMRRREVNYPGPAPRSQRVHRRLTAGKPDLPSGCYFNRYVFKADSPDYPVNVGVGCHGWRPSIHMPREAARIFLRATDVRVERLQDITEDDASFEGVPAKILSREPFEAIPSLERFPKIWDRTVKPADRALYGWSANPWCWVIQFERISREEATKDGLTARVKK